MSSHLNIPCLSSVTVCYIENNNSLLFTSHSHLPCSHILATESGRLLIVGPGEWCTGDEQHGCQRPLPEW